MKTKKWRWVIEESHDEVFSDGIGWWKGIAGRCGGSWCLKIFRWHIYSVIFDTSLNDEDIPDAYQWDNWVIM